MDLGRRGKKGNVPAGCTEGRKTETEHRGGGRVSCKLCVCVCVIRKQLQDWKGLSVGLRGSHLIRPQRGHVQGPGGGLGVLTVLWEGEISHAVRGVVSGEEMKQRHLFGAISAAKKVWRAC